MSCDCSTRSNDGGCRCGHSARRDAGCRNVAALGCASNDNAARVVVQRHSSVSRRHGTRHPHAATTLEYQFPAVVSVDRLADLERIDSPKYRPKHLNIDTKAMSLNVLKPKLPVPAHTYLHNPIWTVRDGARWYFAVDGARERTVRIPEGRNEIVAVNAELLLSQQGQHCPETQSYSKRDKCHPRHRASLVDRLCQHHV